MIPSDSQCLENAAKEVGVRCVEVPPETTTLWKQQLADHWDLYSSDKLWADGVHDGVATMEHWRWVARIRGDGPFRVLFPSYNDKRVLEFESMEDIGAALKESIGRYHFAITREGFDVVLVCDYEGGFFGFGLSQGWFDVPSSWTRQTLQLPPRER